MVAVVIIHGKNPGARVSNQLRSCKQASSGSEILAPKNLQSPPPPLQKYQPWRKSSRIPHKVLQWKPPNVSGVLALSNVKTVAQTSPSPKSAEVRGRAATSSPQTPRDS